MPEPVDVKIPLDRLRDLDRAQSQLQLAQAAYNLKLVEIERDFGFRFGPDVAVEPDGTVRKVRP